MAGEGREKFLTQSFVRVGFVVNFSTLLTEFSAKPALTNSKLSLIKVWFKCLCFF